MPDSSIGGFVIGVSPIGGSPLFDPSAADIIIEAYDRIQIRPSELTPDQLISAQRSINLLQTRWTNRGANLWAVDLQTINLVAGVATYSVDPATAQVLVAYLRLTTSSTDRILGTFSRDDYASLPNKMQQSPPSVYWYDRLTQPTITLWAVPDRGATFSGTGSGTNLTASSVTGTITPGDPISGTGIPAGTIIKSQTSGTPGGAGVYVTSAPTTATNALITGNYYSLQFYRVRRLNDAVVAGGGTLDLNFPFYEAMCADLAFHLAMKWKPDSAPALLAYANMIWSEAAAADVEQVSTFITPQMNAYFR